MNTSSTPAPKPVVEDNDLKGPEEGERQRKRKDNGTIGLRDQVRGDQQANLYEVQHWDMPWLCTPWQTLPIRVPCLLEEVVQ